MISETPPSQGIKPDLPGDFDINRPQRGARDGYFYLWIELNKQYGEIINTMQTGRYDPRIKRKVRQMIATVVDDNTQLWLWNVFEGALHNITTKPGMRFDEKEKEWVEVKLTAEEKNELIMDLCDLIVGQIWAFYDQFMGVSHRLKMGNARPPETTAEEDMPVKMAEVIEV